MSKPDAPRESVAERLAREEREFREVQLRRLQRQLDADEGPTWLAIFGRWQP